jgi:hypothetical protein
MERESPEKIILRPFSHIVVFFHNRILVPFINFFLELDHMEREHREKEKKAIMKPNWRFKK